MQQPKLPSLDIVLPCYNPVPNWHETIVESYFVLQSLLPQTTIHLSVVNDGSSKGIKPADIQLIKDRVPHFEYLSYTENRGKGFALRNGVSATQQDYCIYTDIDFPYQEANIKEMYDLLIQNEHDIIAGVRGNNYYERVPFIRTLISKLLKSFIRTLLNINITDTQAGLKGFNQQGKKLFLETNIDRYLFDLEFIYLGSNDKDIRMKALTVNLKPGIVFSRMNMKVLATEMFNFMKVLFR